MVASPIRYRRDFYRIIDLSLPTAELGAAECYFSADILSWGVPKHYVVDAWRHLEVAGDGANSQAWHEKNLADGKERLVKYGDKAIFLRGISWDMASEVPDNSLGFINVDCDHSYEGVMQDILAWWPKLVKGGVMAFHDHEAPQYGVKRAVKNFATMNELYIHLLPEDKPEDAGAWLAKP